MAQKSYLQLKKSKNIIENSVAWCISHFAALQILEYQLQHKAICIYYLVVPLMS